MWRKMWPENRPSYLHLLQRNYSERRQDRSRDLEGISQEKLFPESGKFSHDFVCLTDI